MRGESPQARQMEIKMKKFVFPLDSLYKAKKIALDNLQAEHCAAQATLEEACRKREQLQTFLAAETRKYEITAKKGMTAGIMQAYGKFFEDLRYMETAAAKWVELAQKEVNIKRTELIEVSKEVKMLEKLRESRYQEYITEEKKAENNVVEDMLAFKIGGENRAVCAGVSEVAVADLPL